MLEKVDQIKFQEPLPNPHPTLPTSWSLLWYTCSQAWACQARAWSDGVGFDIMPNNFKCLNSGHNVITGEVIPMYSDITTKYVHPKRHEVGL